MMPAHTIPCATAKAKGGTRSLSGTFGIPTLLAHSPKMPKEPSSPSHPYAQRKRQCINERIDDEMNQGQRTTANISKLGVGGLRNFCTFNQNCNGLIGWRQGNSSLHILEIRWLQT